MPSQQRSKLFLDFTFKMVKPLFAMKRVFSHTKSSTVTLLNLFANSLQYHHYKVSISACIMMLWHTKFLQKIFTLLGILCPNLWKFSAITRTSKLLLNNTPWRSREAINFILFYQVTVLNHVFAFFSYVDDINKVFFVVVLLLLLSIDARQHSSDFICNFHLP